MSAGIVVLVCDILPASSSKTAIISQYQFKALLLAIIIISFSTQKSLSQGFARTFQSWFLFNLFIYLFIQ